MSDDYPDLLWDESVPADVLRRYAEFGNEAQVVQVAANGNAPNEVALWIATHGSAAAREALSMNTNVSSEVVEQLLMYPGIDRDQLLSHPHAAASRKLQAPLNRLTDYSLDLFFDDMGATDAERRFVRAQRAKRSATKTTLGQAWAAVAK